MSNRLLGLIIGQFAMARLAIFIQKKTKGLNKFFLFAVFGMLAVIILLLVILTYEGDFSAIWAGIIAVIVFSAAILMLRGKVVPLTIAEWLVVFALAIISPFVVAAFYTAHDTAHTSRMAFHSAMARNLLNVTTDIDGGIRAEIETAKTLATSKLLAEGKLADFHKQTSSDLTLKKRGAILVADRHMKQLVNTLLPYGSALPPVSDQAVVRQVLNTGKSAIGNLLVAKAMPQPVFYIGTPATIRGDTHFILMLEPNPAMISRILDSEVLPARWRVLVTDRNDRIVADSQQSEKGLLGRYIDRQNLPPNGLSSGEYVTRDVQGIQWVNARYVSPLTGWCTIISIPKDLLDASARNIWHMFLPEILLILLLTLLIGVWIARVLTNPIANTIKAADAYGAGGPVLLAKSNVVEINTLCDALVLSIAKRRKVETDLDIAQKRLQLGLTASRSRIWQSHGLTDQIPWSNELNELLGIKHNETEKVGTDLVHHEDRDRVLDIIAKSAQMGNKIDVDFRVIKPDGSIIWLTADGHVETDDAGQTIGMIGVVRDIDRKHKAELGLQAANQTMREIIEQSPFGIYGIDADFRMALVSQGAQKVFSNIHPLIGENLADVLRQLWPEPQAVDFIGRFQHTLTTGEPYRSPSTIANRRNIDATEFYDWKTHRVIFPDGRYGVICQFYDLSERVEFEAALSDSESKYRSTFENAAVGIAHVSLDGHWLEVNDQICMIVGYDRQELLTKTFQDITYPDDLDSDLQQLQQVLAGEIDTYTMDKRYIRKNGSISWAALTVALRKTAEGKPLHLISIVRDINERVDSMRALVESEDRLRRAANAAGLCYIIIDLEKNTMVVSENHDAVLGFQLDHELSDLDTARSAFLQHIVENDRELVRLELEEGLDDLVTHGLEIRMIADDGQLRWIKSQLQVEQSASGKPMRIFITSLNITDRKQNEDHIRLLMGEVNHRAKNLLSVVQAIARQTAQHGDPASFVDRLTERISSLAASQDLLVKGNWRGAAVTEILTSQLAFLASLLNKQIFLHGPHLVLGAGAIQGIALAIHELATNAVKYGALSVPTGRVDIVWHFGGHIGHNWTISWIETGGPAVKSPIRKSFGHAVLGRVVEGATGGKVEISFPKTGVIWRLHAPLGTAMDTYDSSVVHENGTN